MFEASFNVHDLRLKCVDLGTFRKSDSVAGERFSDLERISGGEIEKSSSENFRLNFSSISRRSSFESKLLVSMPREFIFFGSKLSKLALTSEVICTVDQSGKFDGFCGSGHHSSEVVFVLGLDLPEFGDVFSFF